MILFIENLSFISIFASLFFRVFGIRTICYKSDNYLFNRNEKVLKAFGIKFLDFVELDSVEPSVIDGDFHDFITECVNELFPEEDVFLPFYPLFKNIDNLKHKLRIFARQFAEIGYLDNINMIHWLEKSIYKDSMIFLMVSCEGNSKVLWDKSQLRVYNIVIPGWWIVRRIANFVAANIVRSAKNFSQAKLTHRNLRQKKNVIDNSYSNFEVIYFPHNSIFSSAYVKDHFYSDDSSSPFHISNILHVEYDRRSNIFEDSRKAKDYIGADQIHYQSLPRTNYKDLTLKAIYFFIFTLKRIGKITVNNGLGLKSIFCMAVMYLLYQKYYLATSFLKKSKIALVGYDVLFPKGLSLALESRGIKTIASQERFGMPLANQHSYILTVQFTVSSFMNDAIRSKDRQFYVKKCIPVGQTRSDYFFSPTKLSKPKSFKHRVLIFDFHVDPDPFLQRRHSFLSWDNDRFFRLNMLQLAETYPETEFLFRGKDDAWIYNDYFRDIVEQIAHMENVKVDSEFSIWGRSYDLANSADLIIAKPTSIAEECISIGYHVLVADYGINYSKHVSVYFPHSSKGNYCSSFKELHKKVTRFMKHGFVVESEIMGKMQKDLFDGLTDGKVRSRIQKKLHQIITSEIEV